jgi:hypothetical protein
MNFSHPLAAHGTTGAPSTRVGIHRLLSTLLRCEPNICSKKNSAPRDLFVMKDPRICRFLPFWSTALGEMNIASLVVVPIRSPLEVAQSLAARDGFSLEKGLLIWLRHVLDAERETRHLPRAIVGMDEFLGDWRGSIKTIGRLLKIEWPRFDDLVAAAIDNFLSRDLKHQNAPDEALPPYSHGQSRLMTPCWRCETIRARASRRARWMM